MNTDAQHRQAVMIGGGVIGAGWAARFLLNGWDVTIVDPSEGVESRVAAMLDNARRSLPALYDWRLPAEGRLRFEADIASAVGQADWIQESVSETLDLKHRVLREIQTHCREDAIVASSTSGFRPSQLQEGALRAAQIIVAHPFNPVYLLPLIELVGDAATCERAAGLLRAIGMHPLQVRREIDAHIADRFLEAVWREALWLVRDGIATTAEIDDAIRLGFGIRWAQMGLFETYRIAGGHAGMQHFLEQFGPALQWPWTKLMDVPELDEELIGMIVSQSDAQSGAVSINALERRRDDNLVCILRALKTRDQAGGAVINAHERSLRRMPEARAAEPLATLSRVVPIDWTDYNGHMNESRYGQVFSDAADAVMLTVGVDEHYVARQLSFFTVDIRIRFLAEALAGDGFHVKSRVLQADGKKLRVYHEMIRDDGTPLATGEQLLIHVSLETRRACEPPAEIAQRLEELATAHASLPPIDDARG